jgi:hypothetical protein
MRTQSADGQTVTRRTDFLLTDRPLVDRQTLGLQTDAVYGQTFKTDAVYGQTFVPEVDLTMAMAELAMASRP